MKKKIYIYVYLLSLTILTIDRSDKGEQGRFRFLEIMMRRLMIVKFLEADIS